MKDYFSTGSSDYAKYRPHYPAELFSFLKKLTPERKRAWDCGTGSGQVAGELAEFFEQVEATDISRSQLDSAVKRSNINYSLQPAEKTSFPEHFFDLVTVAQAVHWFDLESFFQEVQRVLKPNGYIAVIGYSLFRSNSGTNAVIDHLYNDIVGPFWYPERRYLDEKYETIPFRFREIKTPHFEISQKWSFEHLLGYLRTWSSVKNYLKQKGEDPVSLIEAELYNSFGETGEVVFPVLLRVGRKEI
ncbi:class I SAM-dependent methyltransferase [Salinimicrobium soli]|uniref:class I SAM-dependent methyltransferase n=1 Tax=Salinimicrobium soli TaxID=1254399 RepID=UPI003AAB41CF